MTDTELLSQRNGITTTIGEEDGKIIVAKSQDVSAHIEYCRALRNNEPGKFEKKGDIRIMSSVPITTVFEMLTRLGIPWGRIFRLTLDERKRLQRLIQHPDYAEFRTSRARF